MIARVKAAFPSLPEDFYRVFSERIVDNNFNDTRLTDAINHVIDNCPYPTPTIANFISYDKKVKLNTYEDMLKKTNDLGAEVWNFYKKIEIPGRIKPVWVAIDEAKQFNL